MENIAIKDFHREVGPYPFNVEVVVWECNNDDGLKYFLFRNLLKYFFIF
jgi:hypothetical protein